jgi:hypothetical protein
VGVISPLFNNCPTQAKRGLEWATNLNGFGVLKHRLTIAGLTDSARPKPLHSDQSRGRCFELYNNAFQWRAEAVDPWRTKVLCCRETFRDSRRCRWRGTCESESLERDGSSFPYCAASFQFAHRSAG